MHTRRSGAPTIGPLNALLAALRLALGTGNQTDREGLSHLDRPFVAQLATHHRVISLYLRGIRSAGAALPDEPAERELTRRRQRQVARGMRQLKAMRRATTGLAARGIPVLVLKGLPLGQRLYGSPFAKTSIDIDLLVPPDALPAAGDTLQELGWRRAAPDLRATAARAHRYDLLEKEHVFVGPAGSLELHRRLHRNPFLFDPSFASLAANSVTVEMGDNTFRTLGDADQLLYLACHGTLHYWQRLKWLCDMGAFLLAVDDRAAEQAVARSRASRLDGVVAPGLLLCREALRVEPPAAFALRADDPRTRFILDVSRRNWIPRSGLRGLVREVTMRVGRVFLHGGRGYRLHEARALLLQPHDFGRVDLPDHLLWLYVPLRPVLWMWRTLRRQRSTGGVGRPRRLGVARRIEKRRRD